MPRNVWPKIDADSESIYWDDLTTPNDADIEIYSLATAEVRSGTLADIELDQVDINGDIVEIGPGPPEGNEPPIATFLSPRTGRRRTVELPLAMDGVIRNGRLHGLVQGRYVVFGDIDRLLFLDLHSPNAKLQEYATTAANGTWTVHEANGHLILGDAPTGGGPLTQAIVFQIDADGITKLTTIQTRFIARAGDRLLTLSADELSVEVREMNTYRVVESRPIDESFAESHDVFGLFGYWVQGSDKETGETAFYDVLHHKVVSLPDANWQPQSCSSDHRFWGLRDPWNRERWIVLDSLEDRVCYTGKARYYLQRFLNDGRLVTIYHSMGFVATVLDMETGKATWHAPYLWCAVLQVVVLCGWFVFPVVWTMSVALSSRWIAWNFAAVVVVCVSGMAAGILEPSDLRVRFFFLSGISNLAAAVFFGIFFAALVVSSFGAFVGNAKHLRTIPILLFACMTWVQAQYSDSVLRGDYFDIRVMLLAILASVTAALAGWVVRKYGWGLMSQRLNTAPRSTTTGDYFIWISAAAVAFACSRSFWASDTLWEVQLVDRFWLPAVSASTMFSVVSLFSTLHRRLFWLAAVLCAGVWLFMSCDELFRFVGPFAPKIPVASRLSVVIATSALTSFVMALTLRRRGWNLSRLHPRQVQS